MALQDIRLFVMDVDGVLTDGTVTLGPDGFESKHFNVLDWTGVKYLQRVGIRAAIISGRTAQAVVHRAQAVGITEIHQGIKDKLPVLREMIERLGLAREQVAYIGDDLPDIPCALEAGVSFAVADAHEELRSRVTHVTKTPGGRGAVREAAEMIIKAQGKWPEIMKRYVDE